MPPTPQPSILLPPAAVGRFLVFGLTSGDPRPALSRLRDSGPLVDTVIGLGVPLVQGLGKSLPGLRPFPPLSGPGVAVPSTQGALWVSIDGPDPSTVHDRTEQIVALLGGGWRLDEEVATFRYREGRDLSGYEDGTANPKGDLARKAALVEGAGAGCDGGSFVAAQRYVHDLACLARMSAAERDGVVGRRLADNEEIEDAPAHAHVKRAEQEDYDPPAFMVRRSMPWGGATERGLYFVAYGATLDAYERVLSRMLGREDGVVDGLFRFTRAVSGGYYFCPPTREGKIDLTAVGL